VEVIRRGHLTHEYTLKSLGKLHLFAGGVFVLVSTLFVAGLNFSMVGGGPKATALVIFALMTVLAVAHLQVGLNLHRLTFPQSSS
jgi:hypothetical protein